MDIVHLSVYNISQIVRNQSEIRTMHVLSRNLVRFESRWLLGMLAHDPRHKSSGTVVFFVDFIFIVQLFTLDKCRL